MFELELPLSDIYEKKQRTENIEKKVLNFKQFLVPESNSRFESWAQFWAPGVVGIMKVSSKPSIGQDQFLT